MLVIHIFHLVNTMQKNPVQIGSVELVRVNKHGRRLYVNIDKILADCYGIEPGDTLRVKIVELIKAGAAASPGEVEE